MTNPVHCILANCADSIKTPDVASIQNSKSYQDMKEEIWNWRYSTSILTNKRPHQIFSDSNLDQLCLGMFIFAFFCFLSLILYFD